VATQAWKDKIAAQQAAYKKKISTPMSEQVAASKQAWDDAISAKVAANSAAAPFAPKASVPTVQEQVAKSKAAWDQKIDTQKATAVTPYNNPFTREVKAATAEAEDWARSQAASLAQKSQPRMMKRQAGIGQLVTRHKEQM
jgi:hypothetical protein